MAVSETTVFCAHLGLLGRTKRLRLSGNYLSFGRRVRIDRDLDVKKLIGHTIGQLGIQNYLTARNKHKQ